MKPKQSRDALALFALTLALIWAGPGAADSRETAMSGRAPWLVGSTLMNPMSHDVLKKIKARSPSLPDARIDSRGTVQGIQAFCAGIGPDTPDIVAMSRRMRATEFERCSQNGVTEIIEIPVGIEALVMAVSQKDESFDLTFDTLYRAIAAELPEGDEFMPNGNRRWSDVNPKLPSSDIHFIVPSSALGARGFAENRLLQGACREMEAFKNIYEADERVQQCIGLRKDGRLTEFGAPYDTQAINALVTGHPGTVAIIPLRFALDAADKVKVLKFEGVTPNRESVGNGEYIAIRPIIYYVKRGHVKDYTGKGPVVGLREFITEITRESAIGQDGYLVPQGLVPLPDAKRAAVRDNALQLQPMTTR
ncbi:putative Phosphate ABC transporter periplasmic binding protein [Candidatus Terasakiella magnetica]|nr:putative Phosphate ABC transporter periplasmic binding protein [Candidatus Terasakiella magnetica]